MSTSNLVVGAAQKKYNLILVTNPAICQPWDFQLLARMVLDIAPDIEVIIHEDRPVVWHQNPERDNRPTLTFSPGPLRYFRPFGGVVFQGLSLGKSQECAAMDHFGIPVPRWTLLTNNSRPDLSDFGPYVVVKPDRSGRGADVTVQRKGKVRWRQPKTVFTRSLGGDSCDWIIQDFIYTGEHPVSYRVSSLFGEPLWAWRVDGSRDKPVLRDRLGFRDGGISIASSGKGCSFSLIEDREIFSLAKQAHRAFPQIPLLGIDILRDVETGRLYVIEVNAVGYTWALSSPMGINVQRQFGFDIDAHFGVRRHAASLLYNQVKQLTARPNSVHRFT